MSHGSPLFLTIRLMVAEDLAREAVKADVPIKAPCTSQMAHVPISEPDCVADTDFNAGSRQVAGRLGQKHLLAKCRHTDG